METMADLSFLRELLIVLAASVAVILLSRKLRLPAVTGFVLTGVLIGPSGLGLVGNDQGISLLAEIGIVMLLFTIGLEFSLRRLRPLRKFFLWGGLLQTGLTTLTVAALLSLLGAQIGAAIFCGFLVSLSSTAVVLKILTDRGEVDAPHGHSILGILLFQDLAFVPMLAVVPLLAGSGGEPIGASALRFGASLAAVIAVSFAARFGVPFFLDHIVRTRVREIFVMSSLFVCLGLALFTSALNLSLALGAFLAGLAIAESPYSHQVVSDILPFKNVFNSLFFISIGLLFDVRALGGLLPWAAVLAAAIILIKAAIGFLAVWPVSRSPRIAFSTGLSLAQIGEFSFVLAGVGRAAGILPDRAFQAFLAASIFTLLLTPVIMNVWPRWLDRAGARWLTRPGPAERPGREQDGHVVIAGFGLNGRNLARVLKEAGIPYVILDLDSELVSEALAGGERAFFGDVSSAIILRRAGVERAKVLAFAISDPMSTRRGVRIARQLSPRVFIIVRTRYAKEIDELYALGADAVIPEEFETSIEIFSRTLEEFHIPKNIIDAQAKIIRGERYGLLRETGGVRPSMEKIADLLNTGTAETFYVSSGGRAAGRTLGELDLRRQTGATVIAVVRGERSFAGPAADLRIEAGDTLVLMASHQAMDAAYAFLEGRDGKPRSVKKETESP
jgi:monovalent cation:H+ antiporter-2, CPA2 family